MTSNVLIYHLDNIEDELMAQCKKSSSSGHPTNKGNAREIFIREFLEGHLCQNISIGNGEIIDCQSKSKETRNQFDIVLYKNNYPKINFAKDIDAFLVESVFGTIEVKSILDKDGLRQAIQAASRVKNMEKSIITSFSAGYIPPNVLNVVVAYDGPQKMEKILEWIKEINKDLNLDDNQTYSSFQEKLLCPSKSLDVVIVLKKGFVYYDNTPLSHANLSSIVDPSPMNWICSDGSNGNLVILFSKLVEATSNVTGSWLNFLPYITSLVREVKIIPVK